MRLVDTSAWIEVFRKPARIELARLGDLDEIVTCLRRPVGLCRAARRAGFTVRSGVDGLIAACALRHALTVVHVDRDFGLIARVAPLRQRALLR